MIGTTSYDRYCGNATELMDTKNTRYTNWLLRYYEKLAKLKLQVLIPETHSTEMHVKKTELGLRVPNSSQCFNYVLKC